MTFSARSRTGQEVSARPAQITARDVLNTLFFYRSMATAIVVGVSLLGLVAALLIRPIYTADASLLILYARDYQVPSQNVDTSATLAFEHTQIINVEAQILGSRELHRQVVLEGPDSHGNPTAVARALSRFERHFRVELLDTANVVHLSYSSASAEQSAQVLDRLISLYFAQRANVFTSGRTSFLTAQRDEARAQLDRADARLLLFRSQKDVADIQDQIAAAVSLNGNLLADKLSLDGTVARDNKTLANLIDQIATMSPSISLYSENTQAQAVDSMGLTMLQLQAKRADLASRYTPGSNFIVQIDQQIADVKRAIAAQKPNLLGTTRVGRNEAYDALKNRISGLRADLAGAAARHDILIAQLETSKQRLQSLIAASSDLSRMQIDHGLLVDRFRDLNRQLDQARIDSSQDRTNTNVRVIQAPFPPVYRSNSPELFVLASILTGFVLAGLAVVILSSLRQTYLSPEEIERGLGLPVLSAPFYERRGGLTHNEDVGRLLIAVNRETASGARRLLFLSARAEDGIEQVIINLAREIEARSSLPVLIVGLSQAVASAYGSPGPDGLLGWPDPEAADRPGGQLTERPRLDDTVERLLSFTRVRGHDIVVAAPRSVAPLPLGSQPVQLLHSLQEYGTVLLHAPATADSPIGLEFAPIVEATVLVVRAERSREQVLMAIKSRINDGAGKILGVAMTYRRGYIPSVIYSLL